MDSEDKSGLNKADVKANFIIPALVKAGWSTLTQIRQDVVLVHDSDTVNEENRRVADYVLHTEKGIPVAIIEVRGSNLNIGFGMQQALEYANILDVPSAFSSNGYGFTSHYKSLLSGESMKVEYSMDEFPSPEELWQKYKNYHGIEDKQEILNTQNYYNDGSGQPPRYYQIEAINRVIEKISQGEKRLLLVMAQGTGKTYTLLQIIWQLWQAKRIKRVLFLVDRNILADQLLVSAFKPFSSMMTKVRNRKIDPSYEFHVGLYQALTGPDQRQKAYKSVPRSFFDIVVIDECHRGSSRADSAWREILDYFANSIQLGITSTPNETIDASNISYFGYPVYTYTLKQGIQDGFLAPYKVLHIDIDKGLDGGMALENMRDGPDYEIDQREYIPTAHENSDFMLS